MASGRGFRLTVSNSYSATSTLGTNKQNFSDLMKHISEMQISAHDHPAAAHKSLHNGYAVDAVSPTSMLSAIVRQG